MKIQLKFTAMALACSVAFAACGGGEPQPANSSATVNSNQAPAPPIHAPLPDAAFKASINAVNPPTTIGAGKTALIQVKVKNNSDVVWPAASDPNGKYQFKLGNHWLDQQSKPVIIDDGRTPLPVDLKPGAEIELPLTVTAPPKPGDYILQLDIVQENVAWSQDKGNTTFKVKVRVQ